MPTNHSLRECWAPSLELKGSVRIKNARVAFASAEWLGRALRHEDEVLAEEGRKVSLMQPPAAMPCPE